MPFTILVSLIVKAFQSAPAVIEAIEASKDLTSNEKEELKRMITDAQAGVPEWK